MGRDRVGDLPCVDLVGDLWWLVSQVKGTDFGANLLIRGSDAFAGAEIVEPGFHDEGLVEMLWVDGIAVDAPANRAIAEAYAAEPVDGVSKLGIAFGRYAVVDRDADGAVGGFGVRRKLRRGAFPLIGRVVRHWPLQDVEAACKGKGDQQAAGGAGQRNRRRAVFGDVSPED